MGTRHIFRENLKYYRKQKGYTQEKLSELIGYGETYITEIESRHKFPKPETIDLIASNLGIEPYQLFKSDPPKKMEEEKLNLINLIIEEKRKNAEFLHDLRFLQNQITRMVEKYE
ncbi:MAG: helix-turn-helix transcriptional regulator [Treponema sp.]|nr:helix-turn-helix transcriptional regulator [Treponema sp.]